MDWKSAISNPKGKRQKAKCEVAMANSMGKFRLGFGEGVVAGLSSKEGAARASWGNAEGLLA